VATQDQDFILPTHNGLKSPYDPFNDVRKALEGWHESVAFQNRSFAESYARHSATVICDLELTMPLERSGCGVGVDDKPIADGKLYISVVYRAKTPDDCELSVCNQKPVFIFDVETVKSEEDFTIPSLVGLYDIHDESLDLFAGVLFQSIDGSFKVVTCFLDREVPVVRVGSDRLKPSVIQSGSKVMNCISQDRKKFVRELLCWSDAKRIIPALRIYLDGQTVRVGIPEDLALSVKVVDVMFGPF
jgi:hypothetical protein